MALPLFGIYPHASSPTQESISPGVVSRLLNVVLASSSSAQYRILERDIVIACSAHSSKRPGNKYAQSETRDAAIGTGCLPFGKIPYLALPMSCRVGQMHYLLFAG